LFQGDQLIRRVQQNAGDWTPAPGTWARVGEQIRYPEGHFCQQAMARPDTIVANLAEENFPAPSPESASATQEVGLTSIVAAPLYTRGVLFGVLSVARSDLTSRTDRHFTTADRDLIGAVASQVATAIDDAMPPETRRQTALALQNPQLGVL
jgi:GAF domain-containing protein